MKNSLTFFLVICVYWSTAQDYYPETIPTRFDKFIRNTSIELAAYANDSIRFTQPNLSALLVKRMEKTEIKIAYPIPRDNPSAGVVHYTTKKGLETLLSGGSWQPLYDSLDINIEPIAPNKIDGVSHDLLYVSQILYIEQGHLKPYIPWVAPAFSINTHDGHFICLANYFTTCLNFNYNVSSLPSSQLLFVAQTRQKINIDSIGKCNMLKELYGKNLLETIWPYVLKGKFGLYSFETNKKISIGNVNDFILSNDSVFNYNAAGYVESTRAVNKNPIPYYITAVELIQNWY